MRGKITKLLKMLSSVAGIGIITPTQEHSRWIWTIFRRIRTATLGCVVPVIKNCQLRVMHFLRMCIQGT